MTKQDMTIWGRKISLDVIFGCYEGEEILPVQQEALAEFVKAEVAIEASLSSLTDYVREESNGNPVDDPITNIFRYVVPESLFICREERRTVALMCRFRFDPEHGVALLFENETLVKIGQQDIAL